MIALLANGLQIRIHFSYGLWASRRMVLCQLHEDDGEACTYVDAPEFGTRRCDRSSHDGVSVCKPPDQFEKETGRKLALASALRHAGYNREARELVWGAYFDRAP